ncbi:MAG: PQQ-binding-like beta-propeller repeat protein [Chthoniobacter sp.]
MKTPGARHLLLCLSAMATLATALAADLPSPEEYQANWPRFRGPDGGGVSAQAATPATCDMKSGANIAWTIAWTTPVPMPGFSSPVAWGDRVFLSGGDEAKREVLCFDAASGKQLWETSVPKTEGSPDEPPTVPEQCGMAAATVATDGRRVYAMFANATLAAFTFDGTLVWSKFLSVAKNPYGHAASLLTWQDRVIVQVDQGEPDDKLSKIYAFDGATGAIAWQQARPVGASWATPIVLDADRPGADRDSRRAAGHCLCRQGRCGDLARRLSRWPGHAVADLRRRHAVRHQPLQQAASHPPRRPRRRYENASRLGRGRRHPRRHQPCQQRRTHLPPRLQRRAHLL